MGFEFLRIGIEIIVLFFGIYMILKFMEGTRGAGILKGLIVALFLFALVLTGLAGLLESQRLDFVRNKLLEFSIVAVIVIFQPELRRALVKLGENPFLQSIVQEQTAIIDQLVKAVGRLSSTRTGAIIALEREIGLGTYIEAGIPIQAVVNADLLCTIFYRGTPLHDGAVIIQGDRIASAGSLFQLSENPQLPSGLGTRHRAGIGLSEESDALVIIVSEETGRISMAVRGQLMQDVSLENLREMLLDMFAQKGRAA